MSETFSGYNYSRQIELKVRNIFDQSCLLPLSKAQHIPQLHPTIRKMKIAAAVTTLFLFSSVSFAVAQACYNSTTSILLAQLADPPIKDFQICPGTTINIGVPVNLEFTQFAGGDLPLTVIHDDVTIQCGENGDPNDECSLSGGFIQLVTTPNNPFVLDRNVSTDNLLLKGLTFTGEMAALPGSSLFGASVALSAPGTGMVIEDCLFKDLSGDKGVVAVSNQRNLRTSDELYPPFSSELTVIGCTFHNLVYGYVVVGNFNQTMTIQGANFSEITYQDLGDFDTNLSLEPTFGLVANLGGVMELFNSTFAASEVVYAVATWFDQNPTDVNSTFDFLYNEGIDIVFVNVTDEGYCEEGLLKFDLDNSTLGDCLDLFEQGEAPSCAPAT